MQWSDNNPGGLAVAENGYLVATVTFTNMPDGTSDFGPPMTAILLGALLHDEQAYEVLFHRDGHNHLRDTIAPNWFFYWNQIFVDNYAYYDPNELDAEYFSPELPFCVFIGRGAYLLTCFLWVRWIEMEIGCEIH